MMSKNIPAARKTEGILLAVLLCALSPSLLAQTPEPLPQRPVHHSLRVVLDPANNHIAVEDTINLPAIPASNQLEFALNSNLTITSNSGNLQRQSAIAPGPALGSNAGGANGAETTNYALRLPRRNADQVILMYSGRIYDVAEQTSAEYAQSFADTSGLIAPEGVYLLSLIHI